MWSESARRVGQLVLRMKQLHLLLPTLERAGVLGVYVPLEVCAEIRADGAMPALFF